MSNEHLEPYMVPLTDSERPPACRRCKHRHMLRRLMNVPFCEHSSYTCRDRTRPCADFEGDYGRQLSLF